MGLLVLLVAQGTMLCQVAYGTSPLGRLAYPYKERTVPFTVLLFALYFYGGR
jgi:hypothetical protein